MNKKPTLKPCPKCRNPLANTAKSCPKCGHEFEHLTIGSIAKWLIVAIIAFEAYTCSKSENTYDAYKEKSDAAYRETQQAKDKIKMRDSVRLEKHKEKVRNMELTFSWRRIAFDTIMQADIEITNNNDFDVSDLEIRCAYSGKSGTNIDQNTYTIYDIVPAYSTKEFNDVDIGFVVPQATTAGCVIVNAK